jgi:3-hydroxybutyrate dehydrogenase
MSSSDKTALVTGSTSGIGLACAHALAKRGINIVVAGSRDEKLVDGIITDIKGYDYKSLLIRTAQPGM